MTVETVHEEVDTFKVDVFIPGHAPRVTTNLFKKSRLQLLERVDGRCWICQRTAAQTGHPIEAHHFPIERSFAEEVDFSPDALIRKDFPDFDWETFSVGATWQDVPAWSDPDSGEQVPATKWYRPADPYLFVDDMRVNGRALCKEHHTGKNEGVHDLPEPVWIAQRYAMNGVRFSKIEIIHHGD
jgi:hypothetical protein